MRSTVLCYNLNYTEKGKKITKILSGMGVEVRHILPKDYMIPVGELAGTLPKKTQAPYFGAGFSEKMLVFHMAGNEIFHIALSMLTREQANVDLKAMLTEANMHWNSVELYRELKDEHAALHRKSNEA